MRWLCFELFPLRERQNARASPLLFIASRSLQNASLTPTSRASCRACRPLYGVGVRSRQAALSTRHCRRSRDRVVLAEKNPAGEHRSPAGPTTTQTSQEDESGTAAGRDDADGHPAARNARSAAPIIETLASRARGNRGWAKVLRGLRSRLRTTSLLPAYPPRAKTLVRMLL